ncbi:hypothetical protein CVT25_003411 [Psilocybe cyanescens]|uniref:Uncharacterized protein n=1 Tax=Psilocybe cyanescens TaxID=93625 RepID=A0A409WM17_PSICY|nr:hypothetical protein CVT25_003411 [Psilocybe cyanescens]
MQSKNSPTATSAVNKIIADATVRVFVLQRRQAWAPMDFSEMKEEPTREAILQNNKRSAGYARHALDLQLQPKGNLSIQIAEGRKRQSLTAAVAKIPTK